MKAILTNWFAEELVEDATLHSAHQPFAEVAHHGRVDAGRHQREGVTGGQEAVVGLQVFKPPLEDGHVRQAGEAIAKDRDISGHRHSRIGIVRSALGWTIFNNTITPVSNIVFPTSTGGGTQIARYLGVGAAATCAGALF